MDLRQEMLEHYKRWNIELDELEKLKKMIGFVPSFQPTIKAFPTN
ncbi:hypothetical protein [Gloeothece verrucosa]|nr:hypothetical protein [Gloeothece verrucosa]